MSRREREACSSVRARGTCHGRSAKSSLQHSVEVERRMLPPQRLIARAYFSVLVTLVSTLAIQGTATARRQASPAETSAMWRVTDSAGKCMHHRGAISTIGVTRLQYGTVTVSDNTCGDGTYVLRRRRTGGAWHIAIAGSDIGAPDRCKDDLRKVPLRVLHDLFPRIGCP